MRRAAWVLAAAAGVMTGASQLDRPLLPPLRLPPALLRVQAAGPTMAAPDTSDRVLWNFTAAGANVSDWTESSDGTARAAGMSTGAFKLQKTARFQRAVLFSLLNPQPNGAGFVGFYAEGHWDLSQFKAIKLRARAQGENYRYKVYLKQHGDSSAGGGAYEAYFEMPPGEQLTTVAIALDSFAFFYRGRLVPDAPPLDPTDVTQFGLQIYGGVYSDIKQSGVSALEIDWITAAQ